MSKTENTKDAEITSDKKKSDKKTDMPEEKGGPQGPEPTRYGDWEIGGKCVDF